MTDEEYAEYQRLVDEYNRLVRANNELIAEIEYAEENMVILAGNMEVVSQNVVPKVKYVSDKVDVADASVTDLMQALVNLTNQYFVFKELSTASKNLTQLNDEYFKERVGAISVKQLVRIAKERHAGSMGYAEAMLIEYNGKKKSPAQRLSINKLHARESSIFSGLEDSSASDEDWNGESEAEEDAL